MVLNRKPDRKTGEKIGEKDGETANRVNKEVAITRSSNNS